MMRKVLYDGNDDDNDDYSDNDNDVKNVSACMIFKRNMSQLGITQECFDKAFCCKLACT